MSKQSPEIDFLLSEVAKRYGGKISTSSDYETLSNKIESVTGEPISNSTLKRLWGYVNLKPRPRISTLDVLSHYIGREDFRSLCLELQESSDFFATDRVMVADLDKGSTVVLCWMPDRKVELYYEGDFSFTVKDPGTSKLRKGDRFESSEFIKGHPLYLSRIIRGEEELPAYVAGRNRGISSIDVY